jgi:hypothetical protein
LHPPGQQPPQRFQKSSTGPGLALLLLTGLVL